MENENPEIDKLEQAKLLIQLHTSEYQAITNRITYLVNINYGLLILLITLLTFGISCWYNRNGTDRSLIFWGVIGALQMLELLWLSSLNQIYMNSIYLEKTLKPQIDTLIGTKNFWGYETFLKNRALKKKEASLEYMLMFVIPALIFTSRFLLKPYTAEDWNGLLVNIAILILNTWWIRIVIKSKENLRESIK